MAAELAGGGARRAAAAVGVLLDRRDRDDGDQPIPAEAPGDTRPPLGRARCRAAQAHRPPARRHPHRQHAGDRGGELAVELHRDQAVRRGQDRLRHRHAGDLVPDHHLLGDHAEGHRRNLSGAHRAFALVPAQGDAAPSRARPWFVNLFVRPLLWLLRIPTDPNMDTPKLSAEEIRTLVLESSSFMPKKHLSILLNLFDVGAVTVQDIMVPRARIEAIKLDDDLETISHQLATSYHMRLPVFRDALGEVLGVLHLRKVLALLRTGELDKPALERLLVEPYFVPASTSVLAQMQYFQENRERIALVVDEYGELMGLVTLEDIIEEIIGKFTTSLPSATLAWDEAGAATADGAMPLRDVNRALGLSLPTDGPKTLNGLIVEHLQEIPEADVSIKIGNVPMEIVHAQGRTIKTVRIFRPLANVENTETSEV